MTYMACPEQGNNRKVIDQGDGSFYCPSNGQTYSNCEHRYIANIMISDETGGVWVTAFNEQATRVIGHTASEMNELREQGNYDKFENIIGKAKYKQCLYTLSIKNEVYQGKKKEMYINRCKRNQSIHRKQRTYPKHR